MENKEIAGKIQDLVSRTWNLLKDITEKAGKQFDDLMKAALEARDTIMDTMEKIQRTRLKILAKIINEDPNPWNRMQAMLQLALTIGALFKIYGQERAEEIIFG